MACMRLTGLVYAGSALIETKESAFLFQHGRSRFRDCEPVALHPQDQVISARGASQRHLHEGTTLPSIFALGLMAVFLVTSLRIGRRPFQLSNRNCKNTQA